ncbi:MAG TPA: hypothetical protein VJA94_07325 [Candidatus Angelobacter sp.]
MAKATVTFAFPLTPPAVAVTVTIFGEGKEDGPVYFPVLSIVPTVELPPWTLLTLQVGVTAAPVLELAVNCCVPPRATVAALGVTVNIGGGGGGVLEPPPQDVSTSAKRQATAVLKIALIFNPDDYDKSLLETTILPYFDAE